MFGAGLLLLAAGAASAQVPQEITFQGRRSSASTGVPINGSRNLKFEIHYDIDNSTYWVETPYHIEGGVAESDEEDRRIVEFTELPETVRFHEITMSGEVFSDGQIEWRFDELGASSDHLIVLYQKPFDRYFTIEVLALTGLVRFHDGYFEREPPRDADFN